MNRKDEKIRILITIPRTLYKKISRVEDEWMLRSFFRMRFQPIG
ncbi:MAG: hypothetical protein QXI42_02550 [Thermoproteota archaeon]